MRNAGQDESQAVIKIARRNINSFRYADDTTFMAESKEELKGLLKVKKESENAGLTQHLKKEDHGIWPLHFMANSWGKYGNSDKFYFLGFQKHFGQWLKPQN